MTICEKHPEIDKIDEAASDCPLILKLLNWLNEFIKIGSVVK
jgi:hypothetical protein